MILFIFDYVIRLIVALLTSKKNYIRCDFNLLNGHYMKDINFSCLIIYLM